MSLQRQLFFAMMGLVALLLSVNLLNSLYSARDFFQSQMAVQVEDATTSLGLQVSAADQGRDLAAIETTFNALFDSGFYQRLSYRDVYGKTLVQRERHSGAPGVPDWFVRLLEFAPVSGEAEVMSGWSRLGTIEIVAHPAHAYRSLWQVFENQLLLFGIAACICYLLTVFGIKYLLAPLRDVEAQAEAICRREFPVQETLPRTPELRRMVVAMNRMVQKIQTMFQEQVALTESLHKKSFLDAVTELSNRRDFDQRYESFIRSEHGGGSGLMILIQLSNLQLLNDFAGREAGDDCLKQVADVLRREFEGRDNILLSRRGGTDFCVFVPAVTSEDMSDIGERLYQALASLPWLQQYHDLGLHLGLAFADSVQLDTPLLSQADMALRKAQSESRGGWSSYEARVSRARPAGKWRLLLQHLLDAREMQFHFQPVYAPAENGSKRLLMVEALCRIQDDTGLVSAAEFWPMVERFGLSPQADRLLLELLCEQLQPRIGEGLAMVAVNLSPSSLVDANFCQWLDEFLAARRDFASHLVFELPEKAIAVDEAAVRKLSVRLREYGAALGLDRFGAGAQAFSYLQSLPLSYLKVDRSFIRGIDADSDHQFFIKTLVNIAHSCDLMILAEGVETEAEWQQLLALQLNGAQGYFLGRPAAQLPEL